MPSVLITGSNGFIGSHLIDYFLHKNFKVFGIDMPSSSFRNLEHYTNGKIRFDDAEKTYFCKEKIQIPNNNRELIFLECNIRNNELLEKIIRKINPKFIFHLAAQPYIKPSWEDPVGTIETNVNGTINIFESLKKHKIRSRVILACTSTEFGTTASELKRPLKEDDPLKAIHPYGISKIAAELLARQFFINFGIESINVRFFNQTGTRRTNDASSDFIRQVARIELGLMEPKIEVGNLSPYRDFLGINNTVEALWLVANKGRPGETYHICSGRKIQIKKLLEICLSFSSKKIEIIENSADKMRETDENIIIGDNSKIIKEVGFTIKEPIEKTLEEMYEYWLNQYKKTNNLMD